MRGSGVSGAPSSLASIARQVAWSGVIAIAAAVAVGLWSDWHKLAGAFDSFAWDAIPIAIGLTAVNATIRFGKWHYYCHRIGAYPTLSESALIFVAGFALTVTPGKTGELLKAYFLSRRTGVDAWRAAPISLAERATDGFAVLVLTGAGLSIIWHTAWPVAITLAGTVAGCSLLTLLGGTRVGLPKPVARIWTRLSSHPRAQRIVAMAGSRIRDTADGAAMIFDVRSLLLAFGLGLLSWGAESLALWYALHAFGLPANLDLLGYALAALNAGTLAGAVSLMPGGAGAAEATIAGILTGTVSPAVAGAATLIIRLCTVWIGAVLGLVALVALRDCFTPVGAAGEPVAEKTSGGLLQRNNPSPASGRGE